jgi:hypothetical protein
MLDDYGERYPRLAGLDSVRSDLHEYQQIESDTRAGNTQALADELKQLRFATPPFQARLPKLVKASIPAKGGGHDARPSP